MGKTEITDDNFITKATKKKIPLYFSLLLFVLISLTTHLVTRALIKEQPDNNQYEATKSDYNIKRLAGSKFIQPLLSAKPAEESAMYLDLKHSIEQLLLDYKDKGIIKNASVYMRDFDQGNWFNVNSSERFIPGSILKISVLITYLMMDEENPGLLDKKYTFNTKYQSGITQGIVTKGIEFGKSYSVRDLLEYEIVYSDNNANLLLNQHMDMKIFIKLYTDLNLKWPDNNSPFSPMTTKECSRFLEVLFNATYLDTKKSEYAMNLLTRSQFRDGIEKGIPASELPIAHKFGESGSNINRQLHETAILYIKNKPYLLTIMTTGNDNVEISKLAGILQAVSKTVYNNLANK